jgi:hypothetical protein
MERPSVGAPQGATSGRPYRHGTAGHPIRGYCRSHRSLIAIGVYSRSLAVFFHMDGCGPVQSSLGGCPRTPQTVTPAQAGVHKVPEILDPRFRGDDGWRQTEAKHPFSDKLLADLHPFRKAGFLSRRDRYGPRRIRAP